MEDEYLITLAMMHGCEFFSWASGVQWYVWKSNDIHPVEHVQYEATGFHHWNKKEELARDYCKFYKLGTFGGNNEVRNIGPARDHVDS